jgi:hypothetical protein
MANNPCLKTEIMTIRPKRKNKNKKHLQFVSIVDFFISFFRCYCGPGTNYPYRPAKDVYFSEAEEMWKAAITDGNDTLLRLWDIDPRQTPRMEWIRRGHATREEAHEWCNARRPSRRWGCNYPENPEREGDCVASEQAYSVCLNQCSGNGKCHRGMCHCAAGWHGVDCSLQWPESSNKAHSRLKGRHSLQVRIVTI